MTFGITKFRIIIILQLQASIIGWGKGEMAQFKGTVLRDFQTLFFSSNNFLSHKTEGFHMFFLFLFFKELFVFVIDSLVYSSSESRDSPV